MLETKLASLITDDEKAALFERAPLHVRLNRRKANEKDLFSKWPEARSLALPSAFELPAGTAVEASEQYRAGMVEIQDMGSQTIVAACAQNSPQLALDLCAGAGGKTLGLAASLPESSKIIAADSDSRRLGRLSPRMERAGAQNYEVILLSPQKEAEKLGAFEKKCDLVLVDAPCSGTGTWRRNPELRWRMTPQRLEKTIKLQRRLLELAGTLVAPGGRLVYAVCSLLDSEGAGQTEAFLENNANWRDIAVDLPLGRTYRKGILLSPYHDGTDGFYFTCLEKI